MAVTLKQISEEAGVSIRTVNRALKEQSGISDVKRQEILEAAARMGYIPNIAARNLRLRKSNFVGIVTGTNENDIFIRKSHDLQQRLEVHGFFSDSRPPAGQPGNGKVNAQRMGRHG